MKQISIVAGFLGAGLLLFLGGCATAPTRTDASKVQPAATTNNTALVRPKVEDEDMESRVKALAHFASGVLSEFDENDAEALNHFATSALADPSNESLVHDLCRRFLAAKQPEKALPILDKAVQAPDASGTTLTWHGIVLHELGRTNEAIRAVRAAVQREPQLAFACQNLFAFYLQSGRSKEALKLLAAAARPDTLDAEFLVSLAELYLNYRQLHPAEAELAKTRLIQVLDRALATEPASPAMILRIGDLYLAAGAYARAEPQFTNLLERVPGLPGLREKLVQLYLRSAQREKAEEQMKILAAANPRNPQTLHFLGTMCQQDKQFDKAAAYFEEVIRLKPDFEPVYHELALARINSQKAAEALAPLEKARARFPRSFGTEFYSGLALSRAGKHLDALKHFTEAEVIARAGNTNLLSSVFYFQSGAAHERAGHITDAETLFRKSLVLEPDFAEALNYLGYMWAERGTNLVEARRLIEKALTLEPDNAAFLDSLGWVLFKMGKPRPALDYLLKSIKHSETPDATIHDHLGDVYAALKQLDKARAAWQKAFEIEPTDALKAKLAAPPPR